MHAGLSSRRHFLKSGLAVLGLSLSPGCATLGPWASTGTRTPRIGYLALAALPEFLQAAFNAGLEELGYTIGKTIAVESRAANDPPTLRQLAAELVALKCDVLVAAGAPVIAPVMDATTTIPIVSPTLGDPVGMGVVPSLGHPGGNITGLSLMTTELSAKRLELLKEAIPNVARVGMLLNPTNPNSELERRQTEIVGQALGLKVVPLEVRQPEDFDAALGVALRERVEALLTMVDVLMYDQRDRIVQFAAAHRLATVHYARLAVAQGGLMAYDMVHAENYRRAAGYVDKILKGARPSDLPIERPTKFELVINMKTAESLGLSIPQTVLAQTTELIQ